MISSNIDLESNLKPTSFTTMYPKIIKADVSHAAVIASIAKKTFRHTFGGIFQNSEDMFEYLEYSYNPVKLVRSLRKENNVYLLAFNGNDPAGFVKVKTHSLNDQIESGAQMQLQKIYVLPQYQSAGIGSALMKKAIDLAWDIHPDYVWLDAPASKAQALKFYERHGFHRLGQYYLTIGSQSFEYYLLGLPVAAEMMNAC